MSETLDKILKHWICTFPETERGSLEANKRMKEQIEQIEQLEAELASMHKAWEEMNTKRLRYREALEEILKVYSPSPVKTYQTMEDIAKQALKQEK